MSKDKLIPELRFPDFEKDGEWDDKVLGEICDVRDGTHDSPKYVSEGFPLITSKNLLQNGEMDFDNVNYLSKDDYDKINERSKVDINDILFGMIGTIGNPVIVKRDGFAIKNVALIKTKGELKQEYLIQLMKSDYIDKQFQKANAGGILKFIALGMIRKLNIPTPQPQEQQKIASFLSSLDELLAAHNDKLDALKDHKKGLMQNLFPQDGETVPKVRFKEFEDDGEWVEDELSNCADVVDPHPSHRAPVAVSDGIPFIGIGDISEQGELNLKNVRLVPKEILDEHRERYQLKVGDFAYGRVASVGKVVDLSKNIDKDYTYSPTMAIVQPKRVNASFLKHFCNSSYFITQVIAKTSGSTRKSIGMQNLRILNISMPSSTDEQQKIAFCLSALDELIKAETDKIEQLQQHKKGLMQGLFPKIES